VHTIELSLRSDLSSVEEGRLSMIEITFDSFDREAKLWDECLNNEAKVKENSV
jgi:hypothetical protein